MSHTPTVFQKFSSLERFEYSHLLNVLSKPFASRTHNENHFINDFIKRCPALKELTDINGKDYSKGIMRTAVPEEFEKDEIIEIKGGEANSVYIILEGRVGSMRNFDDSDMIEHTKQR